RSQEDVPYQAADAPCHFQFLQTSYVTVSGGGLLLQIPVQVPIVTGSAGLHVHPAPQADAGQGHFFQSVRQHGPSTGAVASCCGQTEYRDVPVTSLKRLLFLHYPQSAGLPAQEIKCRYLRELPLSLQTVLPPSVHHTPSPAAVSSSASRHRQTACRR